MTSDDERLPLPLSLTRNRRARRMRLRIDQDRGLLKLTIPWRTSRATALQWAASQRGWVEQQLRLAPPAQPLAHGAAIPFQGRTVTIRHDPALRRGVTLVGADLIVGGPAESAPAAVERWLRARASELLSATTAEIAAKAGVRVIAVSVGDATSRWGSCSSSGRIRYSWRLVLLPPEVMRFVVAHEVAHRLHMDHSPAFKVAEERLFGGPVAAARSELRRLGPTLRAIGRRG